MPTDPHSESTTAVRPLSRWARAVAGDREALRELAGSYWYPVYAWWRRAGCEDAGMLTQACFSRWLNDAPPQPEEAGAGRLREWLPARLAELAEHGLTPVKEPEIVVAEEWAAQRYHDEPAGTGDEVFQRRWGLTVLEFAMEALRAEYAARGQEALLAEVSPFASFEGGGDDERYTAIATRMGFSTGAARKSVFDFRSRHQELMRDFVSDTLADPDEINSELTALLIACDAPGDAPLPTAIRQFKPDELLARAMRSVRMTSGGAGMFTPPTDAEVARLFPQYEMLGILGRGGMGAVYKARQIALDRPVAIKLLPLEVSVDKDFADRFRREARAMAKLSHPNIIAVHDFGQTSEGHLYFVMEFVEGAMLHTLIHGDRERGVAGGLPPAEALVLIEQVCDALAYAHGKGVVHRDIKPANVMVEAEGRVKVADFGLARMAEADPAQWGSTMTGVVMGTPDYMSPEQKRGLHVDHRSDIYAMGVLLYEALCQETPQGAFQPVSQHRGLDKRLDAIVSKALATQPEKRFQSTTEMKAAIEAVRPAVVKAQVKTRKAAPPAPAAVATRQEPARGKAKLPMLAALIVLAAVVAGGFVFFKPKPKSAAIPSADHDDATAALPPAVTHTEFSTKPWQSAMSDSGFAARFSSNGAGEIVVKKQDRYLLPAGPSQDGGIRLRAAFDPALHEVKLFARRGTGTQYQASVAVDGSGALIQRQAGEEYLPILGVRSTKLPAPLGAGQRMEFEFRVAGHKLVAKLNGQTVAEGEDATIESGPFGLNVGLKNQPITLQAIEFLNLDAGAPSAVSAPAATFTFAGHRYHFVTGQVTWPEAKTKAEALGGHLAVLTSKKELGAIITAIGPGLQKQPGKKSCLLGGSADSAESRWRWVTGEPFEYTAWATGKPDYRNANGSTMPGPYALLLNYRGGTTTPYVWTEAPQSWSEAAGFLVEWDGEGPASAATGGPAASAAAGEHWEQKYDTPTSPTSPAVLREGWVFKRENASVSTIFLSESIRDGALRAEFRWLDGYELLGLRGRIGKDGYELSRKRDAIQLAYVDRASGKPTILKSYPVPTPAEGALYRLEFRAVGTTLSAKLDGQEIIRVTDDKIDAGQARVVLSEKGGLRNIELLNLDPAPGAAASSGAATPSAGGAWHPLFTDQAWQAPSRGREYVDGLLHLRDVSLMKPVTSPDGAIRARFHLRAGFQDFGLSVRETDSGGCYKLSPTADGRTILLRRHPRSEETPVVLGSYTLPKPLAVGDVLPLELRASGQRLSAAVNGATVIECTDDHLSGAGRWGVTVKDVWLEPIEVQATSPQLKAERAPGAAADPAPGPARPVPAGKEHPFVNSLGMKFVPVPITGGAADGQRLLFCLWETRVQDYQVFAEETNRLWPKPKFEQGPTHPAVNVHWDDAQAFCAWLTEKERKAGRLADDARYRLPSDHEWSCAVGLGAREDPAQTPKEKGGRNLDLYPWGNTWPPPAGSGNFADGAGTFEDAGHAISGYTDGFPATSPAATFAPNAWGLYDLSGNVWEWCEDKPTPAETTRVLRGGCWHDASNQSLLASTRVFFSTTFRHHDFGFRVVLEPGSTRP